MRLGDLDELKNEFEWLESVVCECQKDSVRDSIQRVENAPTIDPETLPIVQELRKELEWVTKERNAAIKDLKECAVENYMECNYCKNEIKKYVSEICRNCNDGSNFEHRGEGNRS